MDHGEINGNMDVHSEQLKSLIGSEQKNFGGFTGKPKILFVAETVTLVHVARPAVLAQSLDRDV